MRRGRFVLLALAALGHGFAFAATVETADSGGRRPQPAEGSEVEVSFNPTVAVTVGAGETIESVLHRLTQEINAAGAPSYVAETLTGAYGVQIQRQNGGEIDQLRLRENDPGIQSTRLTVDLADLVAFLVIGGEEPSEGAAIVTLNDRTIPVTTTGLDASSLAAAMLSAIQKAGFAATLTDGEIRVSRDLRDDTGITRVGYRSTDPALLTSEIALERILAASQQSSQQSPAAGIPAIGPGGVLILGLLVALAGALRLWRRTVPR